MRSHIIKHIGKMKYFIIMFMVSAACLSSGVSRVIAATGSGYFNISATVTAGPCTVDSGSSIQDFGDVFTGDTTGWGSFKNFSLTLSKCPPGTTNVTAIFSGTADPVSPGYYYKNTGTATGIGIELGSEVGLGLGNGYSTTATVNSSRTATFNLKTRINKVGTPTPGTILATITVTYSYS